MKKFYTLALCAISALAMNAQLYIVGNLNGVDSWTPGNPPITTTLNADGNWEASFNGASFKMSTVKSDDWDEFNGAALSVEGAIVFESMVGEWTDLVSWGENTVMPFKADWTITIKPDYSAITFAYENREPTLVYVIGAFTGWGAQDKWLMDSPEENHYTLKCEGETIIPAGEEFKLACADWSIVNYTVGGEIEVDETYPDIVYNEGDNMFFAEDFEGTIDLVLPLGAARPANVTFYDAAGVKNVTVNANVEPVYYNLQGVRVANPENGLYIVRRGNDVKKVVK